MNAALYFELVDGVASVNSPAQLNAVAARIAATPMHPLERRVLDRAVRARTEALAIQRHILTAPLLRAVSSEDKPRMAHG